MKWFAIDQYLYSLILKRLLLSEAIETFMDMLIRQRFTKNKGMWEYAS